MLDDASDKLFTASAEMATLPVTMPARNLKPHSSRLHTMPTAPAMLPQAVRDSGRDTSG